MDITYLFISFLLGLLLGGLLVGLLFAWKQKAAFKLREEIKGTFSELSLEALQRNSDQFLKLAHETLSQKASTASGDLESKKALIDQTLAGVEAKIREVEQAIHQSEKNQNTNLNLLFQQLELSKQVTENLQNTTNKLHAALANTKKRGEWGERMAEDVLRLAGFQEGINYIKQKSMVNIDSLSRPDFTFLLPQGLKLNMDVKFPFDNYLKYLESPSETDRESFKQQFLRDVRNRIKEVTTRDYINHETVDYCLVFIPNEQVYGFIQAEDSTILDESLKQRVILTSPLTLYAVLALVRQAVDNFNLGRTNREILMNLAQFKDQWEKFFISIEKLGKKLKDAQGEYETLITTRRKQLERPLNKIEQLKHAEIELGDEENEKVEAVLEENLRK